mmetsp:Transcript_2610/g.5785  ORF Transcript_2610/g.5785 Transcript_2610/m.5785 type:complete len:159 (+) Transcript_2610:441-917(+)
MCPLAIVLKSLIVQLVPEQPGILLKLIDQPLPLVSEHAMSTVYDMPPAVEQAVIATAVASQEGKSNVTVLLPSSTLCSHELRPSIAVLRPASIMSFPVSASHDPSSSPIEPAMNKDGSGIAGTAKSTASEDISSDESLLKLAVAVQLHVPPEELWIPS